MKGIFAKTLVVASLISTGIRAEEPVVASGSQLLKAAVCQLSKEAKDLSVVGYQCVKDNVYKGATIVGEKASAVAAYTKPVLASTFAYGKSVYAAYPMACKAALVTAIYGAVVYGVYKYKLNKYQRRQVRPVAKRAPVAKKAVPAKAVPAKAVQLKTVAVKVAPVKAVAVKAVAVKAPAKKVHAGYKKYKNKNHVHGVHGHGVVKHVHA